MDWMERVIDVNELGKICLECPNYWLKKITTACSNCVYKVLEDKLECERKAYLEREKKQNGEDGEGR